MSAFRRVRACMSARVRASVRKRMGDGQEYARICACVGCMCKVRACFGERNLNRESGTDGRPRTGVRGAEERGMPQRAPQRKSLPTLRKTPSPTPRMSIPC